MTSKEPSPSSGICPFCGKEIPEGLLTCPFCGKEISVHELDFEDIDVPLPPVQPATFENQQPSLEDSSTEQVKQTTTANLGSSSHEATESQESFIEPTIETEPPVPPVRTESKNHEFSVPNPPIPSTESEFIPTQQPMNDLPPMPSIPMDTSSDDTSPPLEPKTSKLKISREEKEDLLKSLADIDSSVFDDTDDDLGTFDDLIESFDSDESTEEEQASRDLSMPPIPPTQDHNIPVPVKTELDTEAIPHIEVSGLPPTPSQSDYNMDSLVPPLPSEVEPLSPPSTEHESQQPLVKEQPPTTSPIETGLSDVQQEIIATTTEQISTQGLPPSLSEFIPLLTLKQVFMIPLYWALMFIFISLSSVQLLDPEYTIESLYTLPNVHSLQVNITIFLFPLLSYFVMGWYTRYQSKTLKFSSKQVKYLVIPILVIIYDFIIAFVFWNLLGAATNPVFGVFTLFIFVLPLLSFFGGGWLAYLVGLQVGHEWYLKILKKALTSV